MIVCRVSLSLKPAAPSDPMMDSPSEISKEQMTELPEFKMKKLNN